MVQLSSKVMFAHIWKCIQEDTSKMHARCVLCLGRARDATVQAQNLAIKLQQDLLNCNPFFARRVRCPKCVRDASGMWAGCIQNVCGTNLERLQDTSGMRVSVTLEQSCTVVWIKSNSLRGAITKEKSKHGYKYCIHCCQLNPLLGLKQISVLSGYPDNKLLSG